MFLTDSQLDRKGLVKGYMQHTAQFSVTLLLWVCWLPFQFVLPAEAQPVAVGNSNSALPAIDRVGYTSQVNPRVAAALSTDYGYTESVLDDKDEHHRLHGRLAASYIPINWLAFALRCDTRYDTHTSRSLGHDDGVIGQTRLVIRGSHELNSQFHLGGESIILVPSGQTPADAFRGTSIDLNFLSSYLIESSKIVLLSLVGFRLDNTSKAIDHPNLMSLADRLALGVSETNALLLGLAISWRIGYFELFEELTWDLYLGQDAPSAYKSPIRLETGARLWQNESFQYSLLLGISPSARPVLAYSIPMSVVEPRFYVGIGASFQISTDKLSKKLGLSETSKGKLVGRVITPSNSGVSGVRISILGMTALHTISTDTGSFEIDNIPLGTHTLIVSAEQWESQSIDVVIPQPKNQILELILKPKLRSLKGTIYSLSREPIPNAKVWVGKGDQGIETTTDQAGRFEFLDIDPDYSEVKISAEGWQERREMIDPKALGEIHLTVSLERPLPEGQIRGYIRNFEGNPLIASIRIEPLGMRLKSQKDGKFNVDVPPGEYHVIVQARGHLQQKHVVKVEQNGVTVLVVDLHRKR